MEMLREMGFCNGIENYSRILDGRPPGARPYCLLDYYPDDFLLFIDESHQTVPQIGGMYEGDRSRKQTLVDYGFRLPSALDNRPQTFDEFLTITPQMVFVSATPGEYERRNAHTIVEQIVRPTGIVDPQVDVRQTHNQIDDLMNECRVRVERNERVLVTTLTKKMSEDLTDYLLEMGFKVRYLHSEIDTLERIQIIRDLRLGEYDVLVGVNLLREGLDLPEVSLVAILDADKEGFLRGETSLIQTIGRAARNVDGTVIMYADKETDAMRKALAETERRRGDPGRVQHRARDHRDDDLQGDLGHRRVPAVRGQDAARQEAQRQARAREGGRHVALGDREGDRRARGGDARRRPTTCASSTPHACATRSGSCGARCGSSTRRTSDRRPGRRAARLVPGARRDLPWRRTRDPYAILVSEVMLQQTQVVRVVERWERWLERWPTAAALAAATPAEVLAEWVGLGYNRRALRLREACAIVAARGWPGDLTSLPGVGAYTAAALRAFALDEPVVPVDVNVARVFARSGGPMTGPPELGHALMDLGATICTARRPRCDVCPIATCPSRGRVQEAPRRTVPARPRFADTDRWVRGRIVASLAAGEPLPEVEPERLERALGALERDGLVVRDGRGNRLPSR